VRGLWARDRRLPTTLAREAVNADGTVRLENRVAPGQPLQVVCFERADDLACGVSGVVTRARGIRASFPEFTPSEIPLCTRVTEERLVYLLDPIGASRRSRPLRAIDAILHAGGSLCLEREAATLPFVPGFLRKHDGLVFSLGQFMQWVSGQVMASGLAQIWPGSPAAEPLFEDDRVAGVRLVDQATDARGGHAAGCTLGMDILADLTGVGDGPFGATGRMLDARFGLPAGHVRDSGRSA
jgi:electron-transferring-flavoprotein dehydrogenase